MKKAKFVMSRRKVTTGRVRPGRVQMLLPTPRTPLISSSFSASSEDEDGWYQQLSALQQMCFELGRKLIQSEDDFERRCHFYIVSHEMVAPLKTLLDREFSDIGEFTAEDRKDILFNLSRAYVFDHIFLI